MRASKQWTAAILLSACVFFDAKAQPSPGAPLPELDVSLTSGQQLRLSSLRGEVVVMTFWASWCEPCRAELPVLEALHQRYRARGMRIVGINNDSRAENMRAMIRRLGLSFPMVHDPQNRVRNLLAVRAQSATIVVDRQGVVRFVHTRFDGTQASRMENEVQGLLAAP